MSSWNDIKHQSLASVKPDVPFDPIAQAIMKEINPLKIWVERDLSRWGTIDNHVEVLEDNYICYKVNIYTDTTCYAIKGHSHEGSSYLGCIAWSRKPRAGEAHGRGNDLADGPCTEKTWQRILADIVSYEMVKIHKPIRPLADIPDHQASSHSTQAADH